MPLTPIDVQQKTFRQAMRGYDLDEVDDFLDSVVTALSDYEQRLADAQQRIGLLESQTEGRGDTESAIARALVTAQRIADTVIADAKIEAERILAEAMVEASMLEVAKRKARSAVDDEIGAMRLRIDDLRRTVAELAASVGEDADTMMSAVAATARHFHDIDSAPAEIPTEPEVEEPMLEEDASAGMGRYTYTDTPPPIGSPPTTPPVDSPPWSESSGSSEVFPPLPPPSLPESSEPLGWEIERSSDQELPGEADDDTIDDTMRPFERSPRPWEDV